MLRVLFVTQEDPFFIPEFFREFISRYDRNEIEIAGVIIQRTLGRKSAGALIRRMWEFYGPWDFLRVSTRYAVYYGLNVLAVTVFRGMFPGVFSLKHLFLKERWTIIPCDDINATETVDDVGRLNVDILVSVAASQKFKSRLLATPRFGCVNIHNSLLPKNRGMMPNFWALLNVDRDPVSGMTVHRMNQSLDDGPIILQKVLTLDPKESLHDLMKRSKRLNAQLMLECLSLFRNGEPDSLPNDESKATYNSFPGREDVRRFKEKGLRLL